MRRESRSRGRRFICVRPTGVIWRKRRPTSKVVTGLRMFRYPSNEPILTKARTPAAPDEFQRAQNPVITGIERRLATNGYWLEAIENWVHSPQDIENVRHYLADYRALTPERVRRAVANYVLDQGDWSLVVLPARSQVASEQSGS